MKHLAAAVLLHLAGKPVDEKGITSIIEASGAKADSEKVKQLVEKLKGKDVLKFAKENSSKVATGGASAAPEAKKEDKKDEKKADPKKDDKKDAKKAPPKKEEPEDDDEGFAGLF